MVNGRIREYVLASEYSLAISATASPILFLTLFVPSAPSASISLALMAKPCSCGNERKSSRLSPLASLRALEAIRRKITAAKARVCCSGMCQRKSAFAELIIGTCRLPLDRWSPVSALPSPSAAYPASAASSCRPGAARPGSARCCRTTAAHRAAVPAPHAHLGVRPTSFRRFNEWVC